VRAERRLVRGCCEAADIWVIAVNSFMFVVAVMNEYPTDAAMKQQEM
jgi:hypothetical protein